jgi:hypothetical protein
MTEANEKMTHIAWAKRFHGRQFRKWVEIGEARVTVSDGATIVHYYNDAHVRGDTGYACLMPIGVKPPEPGAQPTRPGSSGDDEEN